MELDATFYAFIGLLLFFLILFMFQVPALIARALDARAEGIRKELDEARKLREQAQALLASYQRRLRDAEGEAQDIVARARQDAKRFAEESRAQMKAQVERSEKLAVQKIRQAEQDALREVRSTAVGLAMGASRRIIAERVGPAEDGALIETAIGELDRSLH